MTDLELKQTVFTNSVARLIQFATSKGYQLVFGEAWRSPETCALYAKEGKGITHSLHPLRLAVDLEAWKDGRLLVDSAQYVELGDFWKSLSSTFYLHCWGGDFTTRPDGNHFSIAHNGVK